MTQTEINKELESLISDFKSSCSQHFESKKIEINIELIEFSLGQKTEDIDNEIQLAEVNDSNPSNPYMIHRCYRNAQGQIVCVNV